MTSMEISDLRRRPRTKSARTRRKIRTGCICGYENDSIDGMAKQRHGIGILFFTTLSSSVRASEIVIRSGSRTLDEKSSMRRAEAWFVKIACTVFVRSNSLDRFLGYFIKHLTPSLVSEVINRINNPNMGLKVFEFSRERLNMTHSYWTYNMLLRSLCQSGLHNSAKLVYDCMRSDGQLPDNWLLGFLVSSYALVGRFDISKELLAEVQCSHKVGVNAVVYNDLFNILINQNKLDDAVLLFRQLIKFHYRPETYTVNILMRGLCRAGEIIEAFEFLDDIRIFGCSPDIVTYNTLIHGLCRISEVDKARDLLKEVCSKCKLPPDVFSYTTIISGYCKLSQMEEATSLSDEMIRSGTKPNAVTFNALINGFGKAGDMASALAMYEKMQCHGCPPDVVTFTSLIDGYFRIGRVNHALDLWDKMNARSISPSLYTFSVIISGLCKNNKLNEARDILRLLKQSPSVQPFIYNPVIDGYCKSGNVDEANKILVEMEKKGCKPDKLTFTILIIGHCVKGRMAEAIGIFYKMLTVGCAPDDITVNTLRSCLLKAGMPSEAAHIKEVLFEKQTLGTSSLEKSYHQSTKAEMPVAVY